MKSPDHKVRLRSVKGLSTIAIVLGPERLKSELLPHLNDLVEGDSEIKIALAESIVDLRKCMYLGGLKNELELLKPLEGMFTCEEQ